MATVAIAQEPFALRVTPSTGVAGQSVTIEWRSPAGADVALFPFGAVPPTGQKTLQLGRDLRLILISQNNQGQVQSTSAALTLAGAARGDLPDDIDLPAQGFRTSSPVAVAATTLPKFLVSATNAIQAIADRPALGPTEDFGAFVLVAPIFDAPGLITGAESYIAARRGALRLRVRTLQGKSVGVEYELSSYVAFQRRAEKKWVVDVAAGSHRVLRDLFTHYLTEGLKAK